MKIKVYVVDVKLPRWLRRALVFGGVPAVLLGLAALVYAALPTPVPTFTDGTVLSAAPLTALGTDITDLDTRLAAVETKISSVPGFSKAVVLATLSAADLADTTKFSANGLGAGAYLGWAICNGNNGTTNLTGKFPRMVTTGAGTTGGEDVNSHTHGMQNHTHSGSPLWAEWAAGYLTIYWKDVAGGAGWSSDIYISANGTMASSVPQTRGTAVGGNTDVPSNNTTTAASDTENRPAFYELVPLCKV
jgi:hypothetical protein